MPAKKRFFLVDGHALAYRAYFALINRPLITSRGENTSAIFGFTKMILSLLAKESPDYLAIAFDTSAPTFRHKKYPKYKATRAKMPLEMRDQIQTIKEVLRALNIPTLELAGYEADDIIGTLAKEAEEKSLESILVSGDKDFLQLVGPNIKVLTNRKGLSDEVIIYDSQEVKRKFGVEPTKVIDVLGLMGDSSDNVPGVPGIGPKTATSLIHEFGTIEDLLKNLDRVGKSFLRESLSKFAEQALLSKMLVTIDIHAPIDLALEDYRIKPPNQAKLREIYQRLEFKALLEDLAPPEEVHEINYTLVVSEAGLHKLTDQLAESKKFVIDTQTTTRSPMLARLVGIAISVRPYEAFYIPLAHRYAGAPKQLDMNYVLKKLAPVLEDSKVQKYGQDIKYDLIVFKNYGIELKGLAFDTMVASYLLNPSRRQHNLDSLALEYLDYKIVPLHELMGKPRKIPEGSVRGKGAITMEEVPVEKAKRYACEDADITYRLKEFLAQQLEPKKLDRLFYDVEMPLIEVLASMEFDGIRIDTKHLEDMSRRLGEEINRLVGVIYGLAGCEFNINSTRQLAQILFEKLKLPLTKKTKTGYSTGTDVLEGLASHHELPSKVLEYRHLQKLRSTYIDALPELVNPQTGRIHTSFNQTVTATGRLSSSEPNLQNIPIRTELGREIRRAFVPQGPDSVLLSADYSQIDLRALAHISGDKNLIEAFCHDQDIHSKTASEVFGVKLDQVTPEMRRKAKVVNFGIVYGMSPFGLSKDLGLSHAQAQEYIDSYFARYRGVKAYIENVIKDARQKGYITTLLGRRRYLPDINSQNRGIREFAERTAINTPIQGTSADLIKVAMITIFEIFKQKNLKAKMLVQVHDELIFDVPKAEVPEVKKFVKEIMEGALKLKVPIRAQVSIGSNWAEAH